MMAPLGITASTCFVAVIFRPAFGAYLLLFLSPLIGGIARGPIPLRPTELLLVLVATALAVRILLLSRRYRPPQFDRMDGAMLILEAPAERRKPNWPPRSTSAERSAEGECGYVWLLWIGGVPFLLAFVYFVVTALSLLRPIANTQNDAVGVAATAGFCYIVTLVGLMLLDPHLTLRGSADLLFPLLAMSAVRRPTTARAHRTFPVISTRGIPSAALLTGGTRAVTN